MYSNVKSYNNYVVVIKKNMLKGTCVLLHCTMGKSNYVCGTVRVLHPLLDSTSFISRIIHTKNAPVPISRIQYYTGGTQTTRYSPHVQRFLHTLAHSIHF